jgi:hypothetical protein
MNNSNVNYVVACFSNMDDSWVKDCPLYRITEEELRAALHIEDDSPIIGCYPIDDSNREPFERWLGITFDFEKYNYFAEAGSNE